MGKKPKLTDLELPGPRATFEERIEWAGERFADVCEGLLTRQQAEYIWNVIIGWTDIGANDEQKLAYVAIASAIAEVVRGNS